MALVNTPLNSLPAPTLTAGPSEPSGASMGKNPLIPKGLYGFDLPPSISLTPVQRDKPEKSSSKKDKESKKDHHSKSDSGKKHDKQAKKEKKSHKKKHRSSSPAY